MEQETIDVKMKLKVNNTDQADLLVKKMLSILEPDELDQIKGFKVSQTIMEVEVDAKE